MLLFIDKRRCSRWSSPACADIRQADLAEGFLQGNWCGGDVMWKVRWMYGESSPAVKEAHEDRRVDVATRRRTSAAGRLTMGRSLVLGLAQRIVRPASCAGRPGATSSVERGLAAVHWGVYAYSLGRSTSNDPARTAVKHVEYPDAVSRLHMAFGISIFTFALHRSACYTSQYGTRSLHTF